MSYEYVLLGTGDEWAVHSRADGWPFPTEGLFDHPLTNTSAASLARIDSPTARALARRVAAEVSEWEGGSACVGAGMGVSALKVAWQGVVMLRNDDALPLTVSSASTIAIIGCVSGTMHERLSLERSHSVTRVCSGGQAPRGRRASASGRLHCSRRHHVRLCLPVDSRTDILLLRSGTVRGVASSRLPAGATLLYEKGAEVSC